MRIDHVQLAAPGGCEAAAREFFAGLLGMDEEPKPASLEPRGGCWFRKGACSVHVGVDASFVPQRKAHPAFSVHDAEGLARRLGSAGFTVTWDDAIPGVSRIYTEDPFGNRLEFIDDDSDG